MRGGNEAAVAAPCRAEWSDKPPVAMLELFTRPARARIISAWVAPGAWVRLVKAGQPTGGRLGCRAVYPVLRSFPRRRALLCQNLRHHRVLLCLCQRADRSQLLRHFLTQRVEQRLKQRKAFAFVFVQRVALRIAPEAHDRPQMFQRQQVIAPFSVDGLQQDLLFNRPHCVGTLMTS